MTPLTHHEVLRLAAPFVRRGLRVDLAASDRAARRILFVPATDDTAGNLRAATVWSLESIEDGASEVVRATVVEDGRLATFAARPVTADDLDGALDVADGLPATRQLARVGAASASMDHVLEPAVADADPRKGPVGTRLALRSVSVRAGPLRLLVDASTGSGMPADVRLSAARAGRTLARETLASGARLPEREPAARAAHAAMAAMAALAPAPRDASGDPGRELTTAEAAALLDRVPDDLLAVAAPGWRVLRGVGDTRRAALATLGRGTRRSERVEARVADLLPVLAGYVDDPARWHARHAPVRRRVWLRRLKPALTLAGILAIMPIAWLVVKRGGVELHPLMLGITPLMMVLIITLSAREVPVMEIPAWPRPPEPFPTPR